MRLPCRVGSQQTYELRAELGRGGMGVVYLARDLRLDRDVAVKALPAAAAAEPVRLERLKQEARLLATLSHPNIAQVYSFEECAESNYLILEYVPGQSLAGFLKDHAARRGDRRELLAVLAQVARGVEAAHARGLIHRDLKPDNIRVTPGPEFTVKVLDFGLAKLVTDPEPAPPPPSRDSLETADFRHASPTVLPRTRHGAIVGTPGYMSPEQARGQPADKAADVWALGCICYEALTGRRAFVGQTFTDSLAATLLGEPDWSLLPQDLPRGLPSLLRQCLIKDAGQRTPGAHDLRKALEEAAAFADPGASHPPSTETPAAPTPSAIHTAPTPHNLPRQMTTFVGRAPQIAEIRQLLRDNPLVTLIGSAGCGKTRLAIRTAYESLADFPDGVWLVELAAIADGRHVAAAVAGEIGRTGGEGGGVKEEPGRPLIDRLIEALRDKRTLLILDNCEHILSDTAAVAEKLLRACPNLKILATSREAFGVEGELGWRVPSLSLPAEDPAAPISTTFANRTSIGRSPTPAGGVRSFRGPHHEHGASSESVMLFIERARSARPGFVMTDVETPIVARICRRLDGIPLAIELAAAKVKMLSVEQISRKLDDRFRILTGGSRTALERHQTLRAAIDWSVQLLTPPEQELLRRLSVFAGGFTLESAEAICSDDAVIPEVCTGAAQPHSPPATLLHESEVLDLLTRLVDKSMVVVDDGFDSRPRYRLLESVRQHVIESLASGAAADAAPRRERHQKHFAALAVETRPRLRESDQAHHLALLDAEHDNLIAAIQWGEQSAEGSGAGDDHRAERSLRTVAALSDYWFARGHLTLGRTLVRAALASPAARAAPGVIARAIMTGGVLARAQGELDHAAEQFERARALFDAAQDRPGLGSALLNLGNIARQKGQLDQAWALYDQSLTLRRESGDEIGQADALINLGAVARQRGSLNLAAEMYRQAGAIFERRGDRLALSRALNNLGTIAEDSGDLDNAAALYERSMHVCHEIGYAPGLALCLNNLGALAIAQGQPGRASTFISEALDIRRTLADRAGIALSLDAAIDLAASTGDAPRAARLAGAANTLRESTGLRRSPGRAAQIETTLAACRAVLGERMDVEVRIGGELPMSALLQETLDWLGTNPTM